MTKRESLLVQAEALVDRRTVAKYVAGESVRGLQRERIERALRVLGLSALVRANSHPESRAQA